MPPVGQNRPMTNDAQPTATDGDAPAPPGTLISGFVHAQINVSDLERSIAYYQKIGFGFDEPWEGFYAIGRLDELEVHLKEALKNRAERQWRRDNEHLDAAAGGDGIEAYYEQRVVNGVTIIKPLADTSWGTKDFYLEDPDGYIIAFGGRPATP